LLDWIQEEEGEREREREETGRERRDRKEGSKGLQLQRTLSFAQLLTNNGDTCVFAINIQIKFPLLVLHNDFFLQLSSLSSPLVLMTSAARAPLESRFVG
jgi:hypothetical protein